ncbi:MAG: VWA domain-containing protein, partial [Myxococcales bacterium]|nr:VWA domain-containing protein [Myxococcales bacterium]
MSRGKHMFAERSWPTCVMGWIALLGAVACGDSGDDCESESGALVDRLVTLRGEQEGLECECGDDPIACPPELPSARTLECFRQVVAAHCDVLAPELRCEIRKLEAENACLRTADCEDVEDYETCYDEGEDCDDSATEAHEGEITTCVGGSAAEDDERTSDAPVATCSGASCVDGGARVSAPPDPAGYDPAVAPDGGQSLPDGEGIGDAGSDGGGDDTATDAGGTAPAGACPQSAGARVLLLFDISASMGDLFFEEQASRLEVATAAVDRTLGLYDPSLRVGVLHFPTASCIPQLEPPPGGAVASIELAPQLTFRPVADFRQDWPAAQASVGALGIGTPLQEAFDRAHAALGEPSTAPPTAVVLISDGEGNCLAAGETLAIPERATDWAAAGVGTWVVAVSPSAASAT